MVDQLKKAVRFVFFILTGVIWGLVFIVPFALSLGLLVEGVGYDSDYVERHVVVIVVVAMVIAFGLGFLVARFLVYRFLKWWVGFCLVAIMAIPLMGVGVYWAGWRSHERAWAEWREAGWAESYDQLLTQPDEDQDAAPLYREAFELLKRQSFGEEESEWIASPFDYEGDVLVSMLQDNEAALKLIERATERTLGDARATAYYPGPEISPLGSFRTAARLLRARATWHMLEGRPEEAEADLLLMFRLARHLKVGARNMIDHLVAISIDSTAIDTAMRLLESENVTWQRWAEHLQKRDHRGAAQHVLQGDLIESLERTERHEYSSPILPVGRYWALARVIRVYQEMIEKLPQPHYQQQEIEPLQMGLFGKNIMAANLQSALQSYGCAIARIESRQVQAIVAMELRAFKQAHGHYPDSLEDAFEQVPADSWDGKPLHYMRTEYGFTMTSRPGTRGCEADPAVWEWK